MSSTVTGERVRCGWPCSTACDAASCSVCAGRRSTPRPSQCASSEPWLEVGGGTEWSDGKNSRSRRVVPIDPTTAAALDRHRRFQAEERLVAGVAWADGDLVVATRTGGVVSPRYFNRTLSGLIRRQACRSSRHTAFVTQPPPHMVSAADNIGEVRAVADILGHSPDMLMKTYSHALLDSVKTVTDKIGERAARWSQ